MINFRQIYLFLLLWICSFSLFAQPVAGDSLPTARRYPLRSFIVPTVLAVSGTSLLGEQTRWPFTDRYPVSYADDYLRFGPYVLRVGLQAVGIKPAVSLGDEIAVTVASNALMGVVTEGLKRTVRSPRPDGSDRRSFPSGHVTVAFTGAELLHQAYRHKSPWISVAGYAMATATGALRVANGKHHWADALVGAGIGIASVKIAYVVYPVIKKKLFRKPAKRRQ